MDFQLTPEQHAERAVPVVAEHSGNQGVGQFSLPSQAYNVTTTENTLQLSDTQLFGTKVVNETALPVSGRPYQSNAGLQRCDALTCKARL